MDLKKMEAHTRGPIFANFSDTVHGLYTIRAARAQMRFFEECLWKIGMLHR